MIRTLPILFALGCAHTPPAPVVASPPVPDHVYRLDFLVEGTNPTTYTLNLEERQSGEVKSGFNIALPTQARIDVGLLIRCRYTTEGDTLLLHTITELSASDDASTIRKIATSSDVLVATGKPALVTSIDDGKKRQQVTVTATRLR